MIVVGIDPSLTGFGVCCGGSPVVCSTAPIDGESRPEGLRRRVTQIVTTLLDVLPTGPMRIYIEAPKLNSEHSNHLYEVGWFMAKVYDWAYSRSDPTWVREVANADILKFILGKGVGTKTQLAIKAYKVWGVEFDKDPKHDKLFSYLIWQYGNAVELGTCEYRQPARRGEGYRAVRRAIRTENARSLS